LIVVDIACGVLEEGMLMIIDIFGMLAWTGLSISP
jgi:hypothetical protein